MVRTAKSPQYPESLGPHPRSNNHYVFQESCTKNTQTMYKLIVHLFSYGTNILSWRTHWQ